MPKKPKNVLNKYKVPKQGTTSNTQGRAAVEVQRRPPTSSSGRGQQLLTPREDAVSPSVLRSSTPHPASNPLSEDSTSHPSASSSFLPLPAPPNKRQSRRRVLRTPPVVQTVGSSSSSDDDEQQKPSSPPKVRRTIRRTTAELFLNENLHSSPSDFCSRPRRRRPSPAAISSASPNFSAVLPKQPVRRTSLHRLSSSSDVSGDVSSPLPAKNRRMTTRLSSTSSVVSSPASSPARTPLPRPLSSTPATTPLPSSFRPDFVAQPGTSFYPPSPSFSAATTFSSSPAAPLLLQRFPPAFAQPSTSTSVGPSDHRQPPWYFRPRPFPRPADTDDSLNSDDDEPPRQYRVEVPMPVHHDVTSPPKKRRRPSSTRHSDSSLPVVPLRVSKRIAARRTSSDLSSSSCDGRSIPAPTRRPSVRIDSADDKQRRRPSSARPSNSPLPVVSVRTSQRIAARRTFSDLSSSSCDCKSIPAPIRRRPPVRINSADDKKRRRPSSTRPSHSPLPVVPVRASQRIAARRTSSDLSSSSCDCKSIPTPIRRRPPVRINSADDLNAIVRVPSQRSTQGEILASDTEVDQQHHDDDIVQVPFHDQPWDDEIVLEFARIEGEHIRQEQIVREQLEGRQRQRRALPQTHLIAQNPFVGNFSLGRISEVCAHCEAKHFTAEQSTRHVFTICCMKGEVALPPLRDFPAELQNLLTNRDNVKHARFMEHIRRYNSACAFASVGANVVQPPNVGPYCFKVQGQIRHNLAHINRNVNTPRYADLYFIEAGEAMRHRQAFHVELDDQLLRFLDDLFRRVNPFAIGYKTLREVYEEEEAAAAREGREMTNIRLEFAERRSDDIRRYNVPVHGDEVAAIFRGTDGEPPFERSIHVYCRDGPARFLTMFNVSPNCDPMCYPILFPGGDAGYEPEIRRQGGGRRRNVSMLEFVTYRLQVRLSVFNPILNAGKLTQQFIVDAFLKVEGERLHFIRNEQRKLRADLYRGLMDYVQQGARDADNADGGGDGGNNQQQVGPGRLVILPSTFAGSPRCYVQQYLDAMAMVALHGKPDFFITFTCNPKWPEITQNLEAWQKVENRPDLVARVFKAKLKELMTDLTHRYVLGETAGHVYVIEFQKRGLPHAHILIIMREEDRVRDARQIDTMVSAELPDPHEDRALYDAVVRHMIHGPCGPGIRTPCMTETGECSKGFPKAAIERTIFNANGYPLYRRRENGRTHEVRGHVVDNRFVVPYNRHLLLKYDSHLNVEVCSSIKSVKYLFKYIYKGHDRARFRVEAEAPANPAPNAANDRAPAPQPAVPVAPPNPPPPAAQAGVAAAGVDVPVRRSVNAIDEVQNFIDTRYVSAPEAVWRLFKNEMHDRSHTVVHLAVHLPDEQQVYFREGEENQVADRHVGRHTTLTAWFLLNETCVRARLYTYTQIPKMFVFHTELGANQWKWVERRFGGDKIISRMYSVSPREGERFFLRILLLHVPGARSFVDLRTVDGVVHPTFKDAARALHLLVDDQEWVRCMEEAAHVQKPRQMRLLFATILAFCEVGNAAALWEQFWEHMCEDYLRHHRQEVAVQRALIDIQRTLTLHGALLSRFGLPDVHTDEALVDLEAPVDAEAEADWADERILTLNEQQNAVLEAVVTAIDDPASPDRYFFVDGPGGSGKTYLYNTLISYVRGRELGVLAVAFTGIASILLKGGRTVHSQFKLPVPLYENSTSNLTKGSREAAIIRSCSLIIWDEIAMCSKQLLKVVDRTLRDLTGIKDRPFGGKVVVVGGDFRQCAPIVINGGREDIFDASCKNSDLWARFRMISLIDNVRANQGNSDFVEWLLQLGNGSLGAEIYPGERLVAVPDSCVSNDLITEVFGHRIDGNNRDVLANRVILCPLNEHVFKLNAQILQRIDGTAKTYLAATSIVTVGDAEPVEFDIYPPELVNGLTPTGMPPHVLTLKIGVVVSLLRNINARRGLCNGTRLRVTSLGEHVLGAEILSGPGEGNEVLIPRIDLISADVRLPFILKRRQFPVRVSFAMTINKAQGQTFDKVGLQLTRPCFGHGQLYVAFSRVRCLDHIRVQVVGIPGLQGNCFPDDPKTYTTNVVHTELLR